MEDAAAVMDGKRQWRQEEETFSKKSLFKTKKKRLETENLF
jgi:hypothetical protein